TVPNLLAYDPAFAYEIAVIVQDGLRRMYHEQQAIFYYLTLYNESYAMPAMPKGSSEGILKGMYRFSSVDAGASGTRHTNPKRDRGLPRADDQAKTPADDRGESAVRPQLFGSGPIVREALRAQQTLAERY